MVLEFTTEEGAEGAGVEEVQSCISCYTTRAEVQEALDALVYYGVVYATKDDATFATTEV